MSRAAQDHLRFSFGVKNDELISARSTPKFPSIEIDQDQTHPFSPFRHRSHYSTKQIRNNQTQKQIHRQLDLMKAATDKGKQSNLKLYPFNLEDSNTLEDQSNRSIKSTQSANPKYVLKVQEKSIYPRQKIIIGNHFAAGNMFGLRRQGSFCQKMQFQMQRNKVKALSLGKLQNLVIKASEQPVENKPYRKETKKINNSLFQLSPKNIEFRQTKKTVIVTSNSMTSEREKIKPFKSLFQKARPTLRIENRELNNQKIKQMSKILSSYKQQRGYDLP